MRVNILAYEGMGIKAPADRPADLGYEATQIEVPQFLQLFILA